MTTTSALSANVSALIVAGGHGTRMGGVLKHALLVDGESIFDRQVRVLAPLVDEILLSSREDIAGFRGVRDRPGAVGPLAGIAAGLDAATSGWLLVVAGDMPDVTREVLQLLVDPGDDHEARAFSIDGRPEPLLCALRTAPARIAIDALLAAATYRASALLDALRVRWIPEAALRAVDPDLRALRNVNTPAGLKR